MCIDQSNIQEREYQVELMGRIFSQADHVLAWLGPSSPCSQRAIEFIHKLASSPDDETGQHARVLRLATAGGSVDTWTALRNFVTRTWWQRAWIVQEYTLGSKIVFICGDDEIEGEAFETAMMMMRNVWARLWAEGMPSSLTARVLDTAWNLIGLRHRLHQGHRSRIHPLMQLSLTRRAHASDIRDRLFSKYGIIGGQTAALCPPNYSLQAVDVFRMFFNNYVGLTADLSILCHAGMDFELQGPWPSWLPHWNSARHVYPILCALSGSRSDWPTWNTSRDVPADVSFVITDNVLRCRGMILDEVDGVQFDPWCKKDWEDATGIQSQSNQNAYGGIEDSFEALWRTLVADTNRERSDGPDLPEPKRAPKIFGILLATRYRELDHVLDPLMETNHGTMPTAPRPGASNIERRWHGMRELELGGVRLRDIVHQAIPEATSTDFGPSSRHEEWPNVEHSHGQVLYRRRLFTTVQGRLGVSTRALKQRDKVCVLWGCPVPLLLRPQGSYYSLVGEAYVHGLMDGDAVQTRLNTGDGQAFEIT